MLCHHRRGNPPCVSFHKDALSNPPVILGQAPLDPRIQEKESLLPLRFFPYGTRHSPPLASLRGTKQSRTNNEALTLPTLNTIILSHYSNTSPLASLRGGYTAAAIHLTFLSHKDALSNPPVILGQAPLEPRIHKPLCRRQRQNIAPLLSWIASLRSQ
jgi:hypothetical protein